MMRLARLGLLALSLLTSSTLWAATQSGQKTFTEADIMKTITPQQIAILDELDSTIHPSVELVTRALQTLSPEQKQMIASVLPGVDITPELIIKAYDFIYDDKLTIDQRIGLIEKLANPGPGGFKIHISRTICIWDPIGRSGPIFQAAKDQALKMESTGITLDMVPYTDEGIAFADFKAARCDAVLISGMRARQLVKFTGTTDAIGAITSAKEMHTLLYVLSRPAMAPHMVQGMFDTLGIAQAGAAYVFVDDRKINTLGKAAGKKVAVMGYDPMQAQMVAALGATPVPTSMISAPNMFNNHVVDVLAAPLVAYNVLELYKGMTPDGGIVSYPLAQITMQFIGWRYRIPNIVGQLIRETFYANYNQIQTALNNETKNIPGHWWIPVSAKDKADYEVMMRQARLTMRDKGYYDGYMLTIQRKIRCQFHPTDSECANPLE